MKGSERAMVMVSRVPMLGFCTATGCTTIIFGHGTCVEHDAWQASVDNPSTEESSRSQQPQEGVQTLSPAT